MQLWRCTGRSSSDSQGSRCPEHGNTGWKQISYSAIRVQAIHHLARRRPSANWLCRYPSMAKDVAAITMISLDLNISRFLENRRYRLHIDHVEFFRSLTNGISQIWLVTVLWLLCKIIKYRLHPTLPQRPQAEPKLILAGPLRLQTEWDEDENRIRVNVVRLWYLEMCTDKRQQIIERFMLVG